MGHYATNVLQRPAAQPARLDIGLILPELAKHASNLPLVVAPAMLMEYALVVPLDFT